MASYWSKGQHIQAFVVKTQSILLAEKKGVFRLVCAYFNMNVLYCIYCCSEDLRIIVAFHRSFEKLLPFEAFSIYLFIYFLVNV